MLQSELAQVTSVTFSGLQRRQNSSIRKHHERHIGIFSNSQQRLSVLQAQVNDNSDSSHSRLKPRCSTKWIENYDAVFVFQKLYPAVAGSLDQQSESRDRKVLGRAMPYLKAITTAGFLVSLEVINASLKLTKTLAKKLQSIKKLF